MSDRFTGFLEASLAKQEQVNSSFQVAIEGLIENVRDNSVLLNRVIEKVGEG